MIKYIHWFELKNSLCFGQSIYWGRMPTDCILSNITLRIIDWFDIFLFLKIGWSQVKRVKFEVFFFLEIHFYNVFLMFCIFQLRLSLRYKIFHNYLLLNYTGFKLYLVLSIKICNHIYKLYNSIILIIKKKCQSRHDQIIQNGLLQN